MVNRSLINAKSTHIYKNDALKDSGFGSLFNKTKALISLILFWNLRRIILEDYQRI